MCEAVVPEVRPPNVSFTCSVLAVGSRNTIAKPAPGVLTTGTSFAPERTVVKVIGLALAAELTEARPTTSAKAQLACFRFMARPLIVDDGENEKPGRGVYRFTRPVELIGAPTVGFVLRGLLFISLCFENFNFVPGHGSRSTVWPRKRHERHSWGWESV